VGLALPLETGVAAAVADYILHARPDVDSPYIFMTECKPYRKLSDRSSVANIFNKYVKLSGIDKKPFDGKSFHAIRRTVGSWLLRSGAHPEMISQILGHQDKDVLKRYLPIEQESMRICALDFSIIPVRSEVYI
jgi:integrase